MNTIHLPVWEARRSGGGMTITGKDATGAEHRFTQVTQIYSREHSRGGERAFFYAAKGGQRVELG